MLPTKGSKVGAQGGETGTVPRVSHALKLPLPKKNATFP